MALVTSSGGAAALRKVFADLPADLPAAIVVAQHRSAEGRRELPALGSRGFAVGWASAGARLEPGHVLVAPPGMWVRVSDQGSCELGVCPGGALDHPFDVLLTSLATSFGKKVIAIVLTGLLNDGAAGSCAVRRAGGTVVVQTEESAPHPSMPRAAIAANGADLVVPVHLIGKVTVELIGAENGAGHSADGWRAVETGRMRAQTRATMARSKALRERTAARREQMAMARAASRVKLTQAATRNAFALLRTARRQREFARLAGTAHDMAEDAAAMAVDAQRGRERAAAAYRLAMLSRLEVQNRPRPPPTGTKLRTQPEGMVRE